MVWIKIRLADLVKPHHTKNYSEYMSRFGKIKSKHVDFVILDTNLHVEAIVELDDNSHDRPDGKSRDEFVDEILEDCGYKIIHTRYITSDIQAESTIGKSEPVREPGYLVTGTAETF